MGFSLHADTAVHGHDKQGLERLCRYGSRGPVAESRLRRLEDGRYEYAPKGKDAAGRPRSAFVLTAAAFVRRLVALVPPPNTHLTSFHGVFAPHAALRPTVTLRPIPTTPAPTRKTKRRKPTRRLDWATLHQHTFGTSCAAPAAAAVAFTPSTPPGRRPRSASSSSATDSHLATSSRPLPPSPSSLWRADGHPLESLAIAGGAPICALAPFHTR